jgi:hypothetical protein
MPIMVAMKAIVKKTKKPSAKMAANVCDSLARACL